MGEQATAVTLISGLPLPGNFAYDRKRKRLVVPLIGEGVVDVFQITDAG